MEHSSQNETNTNQNSSNINSEPSVSQFECKICMNVAKKPIVTKCGHLYCWDCIQTWSETKQSKTIECPVCHYIFDIDKVIPLYTTENSTSSNSSEQRPKPERPRPDHNSSEQQDQRRQNERNRNFNFDVFGQNMNNLFAGLNGFSFSMNIGGNGHFSVSFLPCILMAVFSFFTAFSSFFMNSIFGDNNQNTVHNQRQQQNTHNNYRQSQNTNANRGYNHHNYKGVDIYYSNFEFGLDFTIALVIVFIGVSMWICRNLNRNNRAN